jgi:GNAT superfamily N-acetyltransferase
MDVLVRQATDADAAAVASVLFEAAAWLRERGMPLWLESEILPEEIGRHVREGLYFLAECGGEPAGVLRFQLSDPEVWPEVVQADSAFVHRFAVRRRFAGGGVSSSLLSWAARRASDLGRSYLRLDCEAGRPRLRAVYEGFGFRHHSDRQVGPFFLARYELAVRAGAKRSAGQEQVP